jgi:flagellar basal body rod protein FlgG
MVKVSSSFASLTTPIHTLAMVSFQLDRNGQMVTSQGYYLDPGFNIPDDAIEIRVTRDGVLSAIIDGTMEEQNLGQIELARFINPPDFVLLVIICL